MTTKLTNTGVVFNNSSTQTAAWVGDRCTIFTESGTFTIPDGVTALKVTVVGAGGSNVSTGGTSSVSSGTQTITTISATGGIRSGSLDNITFIAGPGGIGSNGDINIRGSLGKSPKHDKSFVYNNSAFCISSGYGGSPMGLVFGSLASFGQFTFVNLPTNIGQRVSPGYSISLLRPGVGSCGNSEFAQYGSPIDFQNFVAFSGAGAGGTAIKFLTNLTPGLTLNVVVGQKSGARTDAGNGIIIFDY